MTAQKQGSVLTMLAVIQNDIVYIKTEVSDIKNSVRDEIKDINKLIEEKYVTKEEFDPIKKIVFGAVWLIVASVITGGLILVMK
jgi:hypothetical protein